MTGALPARSTRTSQFIRATPERIYSAFVDPALLVAWLPPAEMTGRIHAFDAREGGGYVMSLFYPPEETVFRGKTAEREDRVEIRFVTLDPPRRIVEAVHFVSDDPAFQGEVTQSILITPGEGGAEVTLSFDNLPPGIRATDNDEGARLSLAQLAHLLEER
ncbi:SRPBCC domain-containing protein [Flavisphingomonas formosensis]|uniref:SRPBCC domain-containing protein n=1 Tax=Flavisphingomonas formosensis TaxID=861534 RepID=UPI0012FC853C|nr:SRPBCC domain-containing protein [Sphingomonas formosensis]